MHTLHKQHQIPTCICSGLVHLCRISGKGYVRLSSWLRHLIPVTPTRLSYLGGVNLEVNTLHLLLTALCVAKKTILINWKNTRSPGPNPQGQHPSVRGFGVRMSLERCLSVRECVSGSGVVVSGSEAPAPAHWWPVLDLCMLCGCYGLPWGAVCVVALVSWSRGWGVCSGCWVSTQCMLVTSYP